MNQTTTLEFQPTLMQKLLGRNYKWWYIILYENKIQLAYFWNNIAWMAARIMLVLSSVTIWLLNPGFDKSFILTYLIIGNIWLESTELGISVRLAWEISSGRISQYLMMPSKFGKVLFFRAVGRSLVGNFQSIIVLACFGLFFINDLAGTFNFGWLIPMFFISVFIKYFFAIILGYLAFWFTEVEGFVQSYVAVSVFLAGNVVPLNIIPNIGNYLIFTPFAFTFYHPMQIYLGKYNTNQTILVFLGGIIWCVILYFLAKLVFKMGLKKNESVGL